jgi:hypothetical protein
VTHALITLVLNLEGGWTVAGDIQRAQRKHNAKRNPFPQREIQAFQLTDRKQHDNDIIKNRQRSTPNCENMHVDAFSVDRQIPEGVEREALHPNTDGEGDGVTDYHDHRELNGEPEFWGRKDAEVEEEDGEFGDVLDEGVEDLGDVVELECQQFYSRTLMLRFCTCCRMT